MVGFGDAFLASISTSALTTVHQAVTTIAATAVQMVLRLAPGPHLSTHRVELDTELVVRSSTAPRTDTL